MTTTVGSHAASERAAQSSPASPAALTHVLRLYATEMRLLMRETQALIFVFAFPVVTVLVLGGVFGTDTDDSGFEFINPSHFYVAAYFGVMLAAIGLIMVPAHVASYRESGVLRRFETAGFPSWAFFAVQFLCGITVALLGSITLLVTAVLSYGVPTLEDPLRVVLGLALGTLAFISFGVALGSLMPTGRAAQSLGLTLFFPMFLLGGGGPPPEALSGVMRSISDWLPITHVIRSSQEPWLNLGTGGDHLIIVIGILVVSTLVWAFRSAYVSRSA